MFNRIMKFLKEVREELKNVSWPSRQELKDATIVVLVSIFILTLIIWLIDLGYVNLVRFLFQ